MYTNVYVSILSHETACFKYKSPSKCFVSLLACNIDMYTMKFYLKIGGATAKIEGRLRSPARPCKNILR